MINAFYTATLGARTQQNSINVTANNIANVNTTGFKEQSTNFTDVLYTNMNGTASGTAATPNLLNGNGARLQEVATSFTQGALEDTGMPLDFAIKGDGFFAVADKNGNVSYTRAGNFSISNQGNTAYLVTANGDPVLDSNLKPIVVNGNGTSSDQITTQPAVFSFNNPDALSNNGDGNFLANNSTGAAFVTQNAKVGQGYLESSSVDIASEMSKLIEAQRSFQFNTKLIQVSDEIEQMANTLRV